MLEIELKASPPLRPKFAGKAYIISELKHFDVAHVTQAYETIVKMARHKRGIIEDEGIGTQTVCISWL